MVFNEKICRIKTFDAYPTLETCGVFLDNRYHGINSKTLSVFSAVNDVNISADELNKDLQKMSEWFYRWKISFNSDLRRDFF